MKTKQVVLGRNHVWKLSQSEVNQGKQNAEGIRKLPDYTCLK